jgi:hypothetical protein
MSCDPIYVGTSVRVTGTFTDLDGNPADPSTATLTLQDPEGADTSPAVVHPGVGEFYGESEVEVPGTWRYRWEGEGALVVADEGEFYVRESGVT